ncbi:hypothetical protein BJV74DRAFT_446802 [Russula compacta]|nr:hypothetical protein BJV74DRAFT_446802 [Russula compacta]
MWVVRPEFRGNGRRALDIIHLESIARAAHLLPVFGRHLSPKNYISQIPSMFIALTSLIIALSRISVKY